MRGVRLSIALVLAAFALPASALANQVYVTNEGSNSISPFSVNSDGSLTPISCSQCGSVAGPTGVVVSPNGQFLYVAKTGGSVAPFSINSDGSLTSIACPGTSCQTPLGPLGITVTPNGQFLYTVSGAKKVSPSSINSDGSLTPINCSSCGTGTSPVGVVVTPSGQFLYVTDSGSNSVSPFSINADGSLTPITCSTCGTGAGSHPEQVIVTPDGKFLYTADANTSRISAFSINPDGSLTSITCSSCATGAGPQGIAVSPDGQFLYTANNSAGTVSAFKINADGSLTAVTCSLTCTAGEGPAALAVSPDSKSLYVTNSTSALAGNPGTLSPFSINSDGSLAPIACSGCVAEKGPGFQSIAIRFAHALTVSVGGSGAGTVTSNPTGISCPGACSAIYTDGTDVMLTPTPAPGSAFAGWAGACSGMDCQVTMSSDRTVTAVFAAVSPKPSCTLTAKSNTVKLPPSKKPKHKPKVKPGTLSFVVNCDQAASARLSGKLTEAVSGNTKVVFLATVTGQLQAHIPLTLTIKLPMGVVKKLASGAHDSLRETLTAINSNGIGTASIYIWRLKVLRS